MTSPLERLTELGLRLPTVPTPLGSYLPAVRTGSLVFTSGQLPLVDGELRFSGLVGSGPGAGVAPDLAAEQARTCALNALAAIDALVGLGAVRRVVKVVGYVACEPGFYGQPAVINGASDLFAQVFGDDGRHARSAVGVVALPMGAPVEVEVIVEIEPLAELAEMSADAGEMVDSSVLTSDDLPPVSAPAAPPVVLGEPEPV